jgi:hypothetical protein
MEFYWTLTPAAAIPIPNWVGPWTEPRRMEIK